MTASSAADRVQAAVYAVLSGDATLDALVDAIGDGIPEGTSAREFIVITVTSEVSDRRLQSGSGGNGRRLLVSVATHVEDTQDRTGAQRSQAINRRVVELLDNATLAVTGWTFVTCDFDTSTSQKDGAWRSITSDFDVVVEDV